MRINNIHAAKIIRIIPILFMVIWIGSVVFGIVGSIAEKSAYNKAMKRSVEVNAVCEEIYNSGYTENGVAVKYATVSFEYQGKMEKTDRVEITADKSVGDTVTICIDPKTGSVLFKFDTAGFVFGLVIMGIFLIVGAAMVVSFVKSLKNPKEQIDLLENN